MPEPPAPEQHRQTPDVGHDQEGAIGEIGGIGIKTDLAARPGHAVAMQVAISERHAALSGTARQTGSGPSRHEAVVIGAPAFGAGPVPGCERGGLVPEEKRGIAPWRHRLAMPVPEIQPAGNPALCPPAAGPQPRLPIMQAATVAHQPSTPGLGDNLPERCYPVLERHRPYSAALATCFADDFKAANIARAAVCSISAARSRGQKSMQRKPIAPSAAVSMRMLGAIWPRRTPVRFSIRAA